MDELHGLNVKPVEWTTKLHLKLPRRGSARSLARPVRLGLLGSSTTQLTWQAKGAMISLTKAMATD